jgi:hypothetical protein
MVPVNNSIILYTTNDVVDSDGWKGSPVMLKKPMGPNSTVSQLQFLQCSKSLVHQQGAVDIQSRKLDPSSLHPTIYKTHSSWQKYDNSTIPPPDETLIGGSFVCVLHSLSALHLNLAKNQQWSAFLLKAEIDWSYIPQNDNRTTGIDYISNTRE